MTMQNRLNRLYRSLHDEHGVGILPRDGAEAPNSGIESMTMRDFVEVGPGGYIVVRETLGLSDGLSVGSTIYDVAQEERLSLGLSANARNFYDIGKAPNLAIIENVSVERPLMWIDLGDTPNSLGQVGQIPAVNATRTGFEFSSGGGGSGWNVWNISDPMEMGEMPVGEIDNNSIFGIFPADRFPYWSVHNSEWEHATLNTIVSSLDAWGNWENVGMDSSPDPDLNDGISPTSNPDDDGRIPIWINNDHGAINEWEYVRWRDARIDVRNHLLANSVQVGVQAVTGADGRIDFALNLQTVVASKPSLDDTDEFVVKNGTGTNTLKVEYQTLVSQLNNDLTFPTTDTVDETTLYPIVRRFFNHTTYKGIELNSGGVNQNRIRLDITTENLDVFQDTPGSTSWVIIQNDWR